MKLLELDPVFLTKPKWHYDRHIFYRTEDPRKAYGLKLLCPVCYLNTNKTGVGVHSIILWQPMIPQSINPVPGRWRFIGTGYHDITLENKSSSILLEKSQCLAHFWIRNGEIIMC